MADQPVGTAHYQCAPLLEFGSDVEITEPVMQYGPDAKTEPESQDGRGGNRVEDPAGIECHQAYQKELGRDERP